VLARYGNIRAANPDLALRALVAAIEYIEKTGRSLEDEEFKGILKGLSPKRDMKITRK